MTIDVGIPSEAVINLKVENVSTLAVGTEVVSEESKDIQNLRWRAIAVVWKSANQKNFGFFVQCDGANQPLPTWQCKATAMLILLSQKAGGEDYPRDLQSHVYTSKEQDWGFCYFLDWNSLMDPSRGFVENDCLLLQIVVKVEAPTF